MKKVIVVILLLVIPLVCCAQEEEKSLMTSIVRIEVFPENVKVSVGQTYMFCAIGYNRDDKPVIFSPLWHVTGGGTIDKSGRFRATSEGSSTVTVHDTASNCFGISKIVVVKGVQSSYQTKEDIVSTGTARISVTEWDIGKGNMFKPKGSFVAQVFGKNAVEIKLYSVDAQGTLQEIQTFSCKDESIINFKFKYARLETKYFELRLYNNSGAVIARHKRANLE